MDANALHFDLPPADRPSLIPWIVVLVCTAILIYHVSQLVRQIPANLEQSAINIIATGDYPDVSVAASGRVLQLSGSVDIGQPITPLVEQLSGIHGLQSVVQNVVVIDQAAITESGRQSFIDALSALETSGVAFLPGSVSFTVASEAPLARLQAILEQYPQGRVRIEGHTDNTGPDSVNLRVSKDRAAAVANYLTSRGIRTEQVIVKGYGATQPIADNNSENGRARNRRIEVSPIN